MTPVASVNNLTKRFGGFTAVDSISFSLRHGEIFGLLGPNGAGKTTTIKILLGLVRATKGDCRLFGTKISAADGATFGRVGVIFETGNLYEKLSGRANLQFFARLHGVPLNRVEEMLQEVDLADAAAKPVGKYSRGMRQRLLIARALLHQPELLILDEPTSGLDPHSASLLRTRIKRFAQQGGAVLLCTHYMLEAEELCERLAFMKSGSIIVQDRTELLKQKFGSPQIRIEARIKIVDSIPAKLLPHLCRERMQKTEEAQAVKRTRERSGGQNKETPREEQGAPEKEPYPETEHRIEMILAAEDPQLGDKISELQKSCRITNIHSQEASLEAIFKEITSS